MIFFKKVMQISLLLFLSLTLNIIEWIPSLVVENIVNSSIIILYLIAMFLVYKTIKLKYEQEKNKVMWKSIFYTIFLLAYVGLFAIFMIGIGYNKSSYVETYKFDNKVFYVYKSTDSSYEVSLKDDYFPIRSLPIASFAYTPIVLESKGRKVHAIGEQIDEKIYDIKIDTKEKNE